MDAGSQSGRRCHVFVYPDFCNHFWGAYWVPSLIGSVANSRPWCPWHWGGDGVQKLFESKKGNSFVNFGPRRKALRRLF